MKIQCRKQEEEARIDSKTNDNVDQEAGGPKEAVSECRSSDQLMPAAAHEDCNSTWCWSDFDNCLNIGGLWDMDDQNGCSRTAIHNQANVAGYSRGSGGGGGGGGGGGEAMNYMFSGGGGGYIF